MFNNCFISKSSDTEKSCEKTGAGGRASLSVFMKSFLFLLETLGEVDVSFHSLHTEAAGDKLRGHQWYHKSE